MEPNERPREIFFPSHFSLCSFSSSISFLLSFFLFSSSFILHATIPFYKYCCLLFIHYRSCHWHVGHIPHVYFSSQPAYNPFIYMEVGVASRLSSLEMQSENWIQLLDETGCNSIYANDRRKGMNPSLARSNCW